MRVMRRAMASGNPASVLKADERSEGVPLQRDRSSEAFNKIEKMRV